MGLAAVACVLAIGAFTGRGPAAGLCVSVGHTDYDRVPEPAPPLDDGDVLRVGDQASLFVGMGRPLDADHRLDIQGDGVLEQADLTFAETERRCGRATGYRYVTVRAVAPGRATVNRSVTDERELRVRVIG
jgi:hypothetical protein